MRAGLLVLSAATVVACAGATPTLWPDAVRREVTSPEAIANPAPPPARDTRVPPGVEIGDGITRDEAVALALWNNAAFAEALAALGLSRAAITQAAGLPNPSTSVLFSRGPKQLEFAVALPVDVLWLRPARLAVARAEGKRIAARLVQDGLDLVRDVRLASVQLDYADERLLLAEEARTLGAEIADIAERRLRLGDASELETGTARVDAVAAQQELTRARLAAREAQQRFLWLVGIDPAETPPDRVPSAPREACGGDLDALWREALDTRPDFRAAALAVDGAGAREKLAFREIFTLSAIYDANGQGVAGFESGPGLSTVIPLLNQNQGGRARAEGDAAVATAAWLALLARTRLELSTALVRERETAEAVRGSRREITRRLAEQLARARQAHALGEISHLGVLEARRTLLAARVAEADLVAQHERACVEIERCIGRRVAPVYAAENVRLVGARP